jgi:hypothetical protein
MSCERCGEAAASGARVCAYCGQDLEQASARDDRPSPLASTDGIREPSVLGGAGGASRVLTFVGGFFLALTCMAVGAAVGSALGVVAAFVGAAAAPVAMIVLAKASGNRPLAAGGITAVAVVVIVFGGCLMVLSNANFH